MIAKLAIVEKETDESIYWMEMLVEAELFPENRLSPLSAEAHEILGMTVASIKTLRSKPKPGSSIQSPKSKTQN